MFKKCLLCIPLAVALAGCNAGTDADGLYSDNGDNSYMSYETNQSTNHFLQIDSPRPTISDDQDKIREAVQDVAGIDPQWVSIVGNNAYVHVNVPNNYSKVEKQKLENKLLDAITSVVPRYDIQIRFDEQ